jgi:hypothetical protein
MTKFKNINLRVLLYFGYLLEVGICFRNLAIFHFNISKSGELGSKFFPQKSFVCVKIIFFSLKKCKNSASPQKKTKHGGNDS